MNNIYTKISFPFLKLEIDPIRSFTVGPLNFALYGVIIATGLILAVLYGCMRSKKAGLREDDILDGVLWVAPLAIICARLYYCAFEFASYKNNPVEILYIWKGGLAIYGAVLGAALGTVIFCKIKKMKLTAVLDLVALGFLIGQCLGRWGNFFNREAFGAETGIFCRMGLFNSRTNEFEYYHPTFLYESLWNLAGFLLLHFLYKRRKYDGQIALGYVAWYGLGRAMIEGLRTDSLYIPGTPIRVSQLLAAVSCFAAVIVLVILSFKEHDPAKLQVNIAAAAQKEKEEKEKEAAEEEAVEETSEEETEEAEEEAVEEETEEASEEEAEAAEEEAVEETSEEETEETSEEEKPEATDET